MPSKPARGAPPKRHETTPPNTNVPYAKLVVSLLLDAVGLSTYLFFGFGEAADLIWAPISGCACFFLYRGKLGFFGGGAAAIEEALPLTDLVPSLTLVWLIRYGNRLCR